MPYKNILEEELKNKIGRDYFAKYDCTRIIGKIDFCVTVHHADNEQPTLWDTYVSLLWAEAKRSNLDIHAAFSQLILITEKEVSSKDTFESTFMTDFIAGKLATTAKKLLQRQHFIPDKPLVFSTEAIDLFDAGRAL